ncbi:hypothetical protein ACJ73_01466 [Blastomyces percursus]|uniref:HTH CENPB-type domain-containing protein n=1 Tax=Blastomyces percursus TaxID=1658174 RepID=A0A1J9QEA5_9EURO|nr:hypothetical protein ACJ73_01466 [Blastomyces percursus]
MNEVRCTACSMGGFLELPNVIQKNALFRSHLVIRNDLIHGNKRLNRKIGKFVVRDSVPYSMTVALDQVVFNVLQRGSPQLKFRGFPSRAVKMCLPDMISRQWTPINAITTQKIKLLSPEYKVSKQKDTGNQTANKEQANQLSIGFPQEEALKSWVAQLDKAGQPPTVEVIRKYANSIRAESHTHPVNPPPTVGHNWPYRLIKRLDEYE